MSYNFGALYESAKQQVVRPRIVQQPNAVTQKSSGGAEKTKKTASGKSK
jgi:hypothetical protein